MFLADGGLFFMVWFKNSAEEMVSRTQQFLPAKLTISRCLWKTCKHEAALYEYLLWYWLPWLDFRDLSQPSLGNARNWIQDFLHAMIYGSSPAQCTVPGETLRIFQLLRLLSLSPPCTPLLALCDAKRGKCQNRKICSSWGISSSV